MEVLPALVARRAATLSALQPRKAVSATPRAREADDGRSSASSSRSQSSAARVLEHAARAGEHGGHAGARQRVADELGVAVAAHEHGDVAGRDDALVARRAVLGALLDARAAVEQRDDVAGQVLGDVLARGADRGEAVGRRLIPGDVRSTTRTRSGAGDGRAGQPRRDVARRRAHAPR